LSSRRAKGRIVALCNPWRNAEDSGIDKQDVYFNFCKIPYPVQLIQDCAHRFLAEYDHQGRELIYCDPPYLWHMRTSKRRYRFDYREQDHIDLLTLLTGLPCNVMLSGYPSRLYDEWLSEWQLYSILEVWEQTAIEQLLGQPTIHVDETSLRVDKKKQGIHVYSGGEITLKFLHPKRGKEAIEAIGILPRYGGVIVHDCWSPYLSYDHCDHGLCGSHLVRELTFIADTNGYAWAVAMKRLLQKTCATVSQRKNKCLTPIEYRGLGRRYRNLSTRGERELPPIPPRQNGKRGRIAKSDAHNLWERMSKVKQKFSGCFQTERYAKAYCRISSYLQSMANKGYNPLVAIQIALSGDIYAEGGE